MSRVAFERMALWLSRERKQDWINAGILVCLVLMGGWFSWGRIPAIFSDQGWGMQVAVRILHGERLYGDVLWNYGPLPVYVFAALFRLFGTSILVFSAVGLGLATTASILAYRVARHLLSPSLSLIAVSVAFLTYDGGFLTFVSPYTTAVSWGAVLGLATLWSLLLAAKGRWMLGMVLGGCAAGLSMLTKPEFALATAGTAGIVLFLMILFPDAVGAQRHKRWFYAVGFLVPCLVVGLGSYALLAGRVSWGAIWRGITGYRSFQVMLTPRGRPQSLSMVSYLVLGSGLDLLGLALYGAIVVPLRKLGRIWWIIASSVLGLTLSVVGFVALGVQGRGLVRSSVLAILSSGSLVLLAVLAIAVRDVVNSIVQKLCADDGLPLGLLSIVVYSCLAAARFFFVFPRALFKVHVLTLVPLVCWLLASWLPDRLVDSCSGVRVFPVGKRLRLVAVLLWGAINIRWMYSYYIGPTSLSLETQRGNVLVRERLFHEEYEHLWSSILSLTEPGDPVCVMGPFPGFSFLAQRSNPTEVDYWEPQIDYGDEILLQLEIGLPKLIARSLSDQEWITRSIDADGRLARLLEEHYVKMWEDGAFVIYELGHTVSR